MNYYIFSLKMCLIEVINLIKETAMNVVDAVPARRAYRAQLSKISLLRKQDSNDI